MGLGSGIRGPGAGKTFSGSRVQASKMHRTPDPRSGSATLVKIMSGFSDPSLTQKKLFSWILYCLDTVMTHEVLTAVLFLSFDTDTGLKQALATVNDYNPLMKDFPINDLLSATELDRIRTSVQVPLDIFGLRNRTVPFHDIPYSHRTLRLIHFTQKTCAKSSLISLIKKKLSC
jgi:hypothetical protein